jgi:predicted dehydrogenase
MSAGSNDSTLLESFRAEIEDFVDSVIEGRQPGATITHGLDILRVLDGIYRSAQTGKEIDLHAESTPNLALASD